MLNHPPKLNEEHDPFKVYNIGNNHPVRLMKFIEILEDAIGRKAEKEYLPMQMGDVYQTYADIDDLEKISDSIRRPPWRRDLPHSPSGIKIIIIRNNHLIEEVCP